jgi:hypothetical protein
MTLNKESIQALGWQFDDTSSTDSKFNYSITIPTLKHSGEIFTPDSEELLNSDCFYLTYSCEPPYSLYHTYNTIISNPYGVLIFYGMLNITEELELIMRLTGVPITKTVKKDDIINS